MGRGTERETSNQEASRARSEQDCACATCGMLLEMRSRSLLAWMMLLGALLVPSVRVWNTRTRTLVSAQQQLVRLSREEKV